MKRRAFTMVELMVSVTIGLIVMLIVVSAFRAAGIASAVSMIKIDVNNNARLAYSKFATDAQNLVPAGNLKLFGSGASGHTAIVFLSSADRLDRDFNGEVGAFTVYNAMIYKGGEWQEDVRTPPVQYDYMYDLFWVRYWFAPDPASTADGGNTRDALYRAVYAPVANSGNAPAAGTIPGAGNFGGTNKLVTEIKANSGWFLGTDGKGVEISGGDKDYAYMDTRAATPVGTLVLRPASIDLRFAFNMKELTDGGSGLTEQVFEYTLRVPGPK